MPVFTPPTLSTIVLTGYLDDWKTLAVNVKFPGEDVTRISFVGSALGGTVHMFTTQEPKGVLVRHPEEFGSFDEEWVRKYFAAYFTRTM